MSDVAGLSVDERRARVVVSLLTEPNDPVMGGLLRRVGAVRRSDCSNRHWRTWSGPCLCPGFLGH